MPIHAALECSHAPFFQTRDNLFFPFSPLFFSFRSCLFAYYFSGFGGNRFCPFGRCFTFAKRWSPPKLPQIRQSRRFIRKREKTSFCYSSFRDEKWPSFSKQGLFYLTVFYWGSLEKSIIKFKHQKSSSNFDRKACQKKQNGIDTRALERKRAATAPAPLPRYTLKTFKSLKIIEIP